jgi:hypothetical protein
MAESRTGTRRGLESSPPLVTAEGIKPLPPTGARKVDLRTLFFYGYTGITPAMCMRLTNIGWPVPGRLQRRRQHLLRRRQVLPGDATARHPRGTLLIADPVRQRNEVDAADPQRFPRAGSQRYPPRPPRPTPTGRPPSTWALRSRRGSPRATGSRPSPARDGSSSCACTAPWPPSSTSSADLELSITLPITPAHSRTARDFGSFGPST